MSSLTLFTSFDYTIIKLGHILSDLKHAGATLEVLRAQMVVLQVQLHQLTSITRTMLDLLQRGAHILD
eukprot:11831272-Prorocentrum_lima.AAC.1